jgi:Mg/Co/Ni transporter MgtE
LLSLSTQGVLAVLRVDNDAARAVTEEEIAASLEEGREAGVIEQHEHQMVQNVFRLDDRPLTSLMVPRSDVHWIDAACSVAQALQQASAGSSTGAHSWYPVCRGSLDEVVGVISVARLLELGPQEPLPVGAHAQAAAFLPETLSGMELLEQFRQRAGRMVFVVDEYGVVQGLMTPRDLLEAITGELQPGTPRMPGLCSARMGAGCSMAWSRCLNSRRAWIFANCPTRTVGAITPWPACYWPNLGTCPAWESALRAWAGYSKWWIWTENALTRYCPQGKLIAPKG